MEKRKWVVEVVSSQTVLLGTLYHTGYKGSLGAILNIMGPAIFKKKGMFFINAWGIAPLHVRLLVANCADERRHTDRQKDIQTDRQKGRQAERHTNIQTDRLTYRQ